MNIFKNCTQFFHGNEILTACEVILAELIKITELIPEESVLKLQKENYPTHTDNTIGLFAFEFNNSSSSVEAFWNGFRIPDIPSSFKVSPTSFTTLNRIVRDYGNLEVFRYLIYPDSNEFIIMIRCEHIYCDNTKKFKDICSSISPTTIMIAQIPLRLKFKFI